MCLPWAKYSDVDVYSARLPVSQFCHHITIFYYWKTTRQNLISNNWCLPSRYYQLFTYIQLAA